MYHLKLIKGLSYCNSDVKATADKPDVFVEDEGIAQAAVSSGYFVRLNEPEGGEMLPSDIENEEVPDEEVPDEDKAGKSFDTELAAKTVVELKAFAIEHDIDISACKNKGEILKTISVALGGSETMIELQRD